MRYPFVLIVLLEAKVPFSFQESGGVTGLYRHLFHISALHFAYWLCVSPVNRCVRL